MAFTRLGSAKARSTDTQGFTTAGFDSTGAVILCGFTADYGAVTAGVVTNNHSDTVVMGTEQVLSGYTRVRAFWILAPTADANYTLTFAGTSFYPSACWAWYSAASAAAFVMQHGLAGSGTVNLVPDGDNQLLICGSVHQLSDTSTSLLTERQDQAYTPSENFGSSFADEIQTTATTRSPEVTGCDASAGVVFKEAAGGGGRTAKNTRPFPLGVDIGVQRGISL